MTDKIKPETLIDAADFFQNKTWANQGRAALAALKNLDPEMARRIVTYILTLTIAECRAGLGLSDEIDYDYDLPIYRAVNEVYAEYYNGCYFCNKEIDANEVEFNRETKVCAICKLKLANLVQALGIPPGRLIAGVGVRKVQKTRFKLKE
jgi:hypothetical protein